MRVLVCGGRDFGRWDVLLATLDDLHAQRPIDVIMHGGAPGADTMAEDWAKLRGAFNLPYYAAWKKHGRAAGPIRNQLMLDEGKPDLVVAFPGGAGTADMVRRATAAGVPVVTTAPED
jgi:hypothetical protein